MTDEEFAALLTAPFTVTPHDDNCQCPLHTDDPEIERHTPRYPVSNPSTP